MKETEVEIDVEGITLLGDLALPTKDVKGVVLFAHGSGSSRFSPRNKFVAKQLQDAGIGTLLLDLLTLEEEREEAQTAHLRFNILLLASRLAHATNWVIDNSSTKGLPLGYFGASTGAAAALVAATEVSANIKAIVSRGGRPDLAGYSLTKVAAPTLLIVGGADTLVLQLNQQALELLACEKRLEVVPRATHLFEEPGTLEEAARLARLWFQKHL